VKHLPILVRHRGCLSRLIAAAVVIGATLVAGGCAADPETDPHRAPGAAAHEVVVTGDDITGVTARIIDWTPGKNNALPPQDDIEVQIRFTGDQEWTLSSQDIELAVCAVTEQQVVVMCGRAGITVYGTSQDPYTRTADTRTRITTDQASGHVADVLLLPDQYEYPRVSASVDPKDGDDYVPPRSPRPGDRI
jgi:hypothetical protein